MSELARITRELVDEFALDLSGLTVFTEAANAPYSVTAALALAAGARVIARSRNSRHATAAAAARDTRRLAREIGALERLTVQTGWGGISDAAIVTNTGLLRPWTRARIARIGRGAVLTLMYEAWELREGEVDLAACRRKGVRVIGVNERSKRFPVFEHVGGIAVKMIEDGGFALDGLRIRLIGEGDFAECARRHLRRGGARVSTSTPAGGPHPDLFVFADYSCRRAFDWRALDRTVGKNTPILFLTGPRSRPRLERLAPIAPIPSYQHMARNFATLGPRPMAELHALSYRAALDFLRGRPPRFWQPVV